MKKQRLKHRFVSILDSFISSQYLHHTDQHYQARLLVGCILSILFGMMVFWPFFSKIDALGAEAIQYYRLFVIPIFSYSLFLLWLLRTGDHYRFVAGSMVVLSAAVLFTGVLITGGPQITEMLPAMPIPMLLAFILLGLQAGTITAFAIAAMMIFLFLLDGLGVSFINVSPAGAAEALRAFNWAYSFITLGLLIGLYEEMSRRLLRERNLERSRLQHLATHDVLTGLPNRQRFEDEVQRALLMADRGQYAVAIAMVDLNSFKPINDRLGHQVGDLVLQMVGYCFNSQLRQTDLAARLGGDEFALILNHIHDEKDVSQLCEKLLAGLSIPIVLEDGQQVQVSASIGVALYPEHAHHAAQLLLQADQAMYLAKRRHPTGGYAISCPVNKSSHDCTSDIDQSNTPYPDSSLH